MARTIGSDGERTARAIREAAAVLIARHGYEATSMRMLAAQVGVQPAALYRYFPTKQDLLFALMHEHMDSLMASWSATEQPDMGPRARLAAFVEHHIRFHIARRLATQISNMELRSLTREHLSAILRLRNAYEKSLRSILREGQARGVFAGTDVELTAMAIIQMITGVIVWYRPGERLSVDEVASIYLGMTMRLAGVQNDRETDDVRPRARLRSG
jgi:AcrR family transcriptional regulator